MNDFNTNPVITTPFTAQTSSNSVAEIPVTSPPSVAYRVPSNLPSFKPNSTPYGDSKFSNPRDFLTRFQITMTASSIPESAWIKIIPLCLANNEATWVATLNCDSFTNFKTAFITHFTNPLQSRTNRANLYSARVTRDETIQQFTDRFSELARICELPLDSEEVIEYYRAALPLMLQQELNHIMITVQVVDPNKKFDVTKLSTRRSTLLDKILNQNTIHVYLLTQIRQIKLLILLPHAITANYLDTTNLNAEVNNMILVMVQLPTVTNLSQTQLLTTQPINAGPLPLQQLPAAPE